MTVEIQSQDLQGMPQDVASAQQGLTDDQRPVYNKVQVSDVVKRERDKAYEKGRRDRDMEMQLTQSPLQNPMQPQPSLQNVSPQGQQLTPDAVKEMISREAPKAIQDHVRALQIQQTANQFAAKMEAAESKYPGLREKLNKLDYSTAAPVVQLANNTENAADVMNELIENPMKMANMITLAYSQPNVAQSAMQSLSQSIKQNESAKAANQNQANDPLNPISSSANTGMDNGAPKTVGDFRKIFGRRRQ